MATRTVEPNVTAADGAVPAPERRRLNPGRIAAWAALVILILITLFPFYWMLRTALSNGRSLFSNPASLLPTDFTWGAFRRVLGLATQEEARAEGGSGASVNFLLYLRNSVIFATVATAGQVFFSALAAYAFARLKWPGRDRPSSRSPSGPGSTVTLGVPSGYMARSLGEKTRSHPRASADCRSTSSCRG